MDTKTLSKPASDVIDQYLHFHAGPAITSIPYYNNKSIKARATLRTYVGKGSPEDIREEFEAIVLKNKIDSKAFTNEDVKKLLVDNGLGIECSGFTYHALEAESQSRGLGTLGKRITFINCNGFIGQIRCSIRPVENCDVETFASDLNSKKIALKDIQPGDLITMTPNLDSSERNHILIVREVHYENSLPRKILYSHSIAYPEDGLYGTGIRNGEIRIDNTDDPITQANWSENNREGNSNPLFIRAKRSKTEVRRLNWF
jgi:hypothetical protein